MKRANTLSPFGTARGAVATGEAENLAGVYIPADHDIVLLAWIEQLREPLKTLYSLEDDIAYIAWELARWQEGLAASRTASAGPSGALGIDRASTGEYAHRHGSWKSAILHAGSSLSEVFWCESARPQDSP